jgi:hypothetical protein
MMNRLLVVALLGGLLLFGTSCSDPTGVGSELVGSEGQGTPDVYEIAPDSFGTSSSPTLTGFVRSAPDPGSGTGQPWRVLAGTVNDPIVGTIEAEGYIDFLGTASRVGSISEDPVDSLDAELRLQPTYFHGDTLSTYEVNLFELREEADMQRAPADTSFEVLRQLGSTVSISGRGLTDSVVTLPVPEVWIEDHIEAIRSDSFRTAVNGFKIAAASNNPTLSDPQVVAGFDLNSATLRVSASSDTVDFRSLKAFTHIEQRGTPAVPLDDQRLLLDGVGTGLSMSWDYTQPPFSDTLQNTPLNQADITAPIDDSTMEASLDLLGNPPAFTRPGPNGYRVLATRADGAPSCSRIGLPQVPDTPAQCILPTNTSVAPAEARLSSRTSFTLMEQVLFDTPLFSSFRVEIATRSSSGTPPEGTIGRGLPSTLPALVRTDRSLPIEDLPRTTLIVTPL